MKRVHANSPGAGRHQYINNDKQGGHNILGIYIYIYIYSMSMDLCETIQPFTMRKPSCARSWQPQARKKLHACQLAMRQLA